jgi:hypothetical protein
MKPNAKPVMKAANVYTTCGSKWKIPKTAAEIITATVKAYFLDFAMLSVLKNEFWRNPRKANSSHMPAKVKDEATAIKPVGLALKRVSNWLASFTV